MNDPAVREKFIDNALLMSSSDEDEDEASSSQQDPKKPRVFHPPSTSNKASKGRTESAFKVQ